MPYFSLPLQNRISSLCKENENQLGEIKRLNEELSAKGDLKSKLAASKQTVKELQGQVQDLNTQVTEYQSQLTQLRDTDIVLYKNKLVKALHDNGELQSLIRKRDSEIAELNAKIKGLFDELEDVQTSNSGLQREREQLLAEISALKRQLLSSKSKGESLSYSPISTLWS